MASKTLAKLPSKIEIPLSRDEIHKGLDMILDSKTSLARVIPEVLLQALWGVKCQRKEAQTRLALGLEAFIDSHVGKGGAR
jgi:hypothetical protein